MIKYKQGLNSIPCDRILELLHTGDRRGRGGREQGLVPLLYPNAPQRMAALLQQTANREAVK